MTHFTPDPTAGFREVPPSATGSDYLANIVTMVPTFGLPSVTLASLQPSVKPQGEGSKGYEPGLCTYSLGFDGQVVNDSTGHPFGIRISVETWFSDRISNPGADLFDWQRFAAPHVGATLTFTPAGSNVHLRNSSGPNVAWEADSFLFDVPTQQLLFHVPGLGIPLGILIATLHATGEFGTL
jgi:hypothetical protein